MASFPLLLFIYQVPASPSTHRAYVWRKLKALGALYLQNSICVLPSLAALESALESLRAEIAERGGEAQLLHIELPERAERESLVERFHRQMEDEYGELIDKCADFHAELAKERGKRHLTFGELEENEAELQKLAAWLPKIEGRDYFSAPIRERAASELASCQEDYAAFEAEVEAASIK